MTLKNISNNSRNKILLIALGCLFFLPYLGEIHLFDWDEVNFAEAAREMITTGDYLTVRIDYEPFHEKPPLFFWMQAASMKMFGINETAARLPNALTGIITLIVLYTIGRRLFDERFGLIWSLTYLGSLLPHFYFKTGIIDPVFNLFMFMAVYYLYRLSLESGGGAATNKPARMHVMLAGAFSALAVLTKGPVGYLMPLIAWLVYWFINRRHQGFQFRSFALFTFVALLPAVLWYAIVFVNAGGGVIWEFVEYQARLLLSSEGGHGGPVYYHFIVLFLGCFPASVLALRAFRRNDDDSRQQQQFKMWMIILLGAVLVVFSAVNTKIIHYSSLAYFPITFLAAYAAHAMLYRGLASKRSTVWLVAIIGIAIGAVTLAIAVALQNADRIAPLIKDDFTREILSTPVAWSGAEFLAGAFYIAAMILVVVLLARKRLLQGILILYAATALFIFIYLPFVVPKIESYVQGSAVDFYKSHKDCDCYVHVLDISSYRYGYLFYSDKPPGLSGFYNPRVPRKGLETWLLEGDIDKPAYFMAKEKDTARWLKYDNLKVTGAAPGFVFLMREPAGHYAGRPTGDSKK